jgi:hypothetical protein
VNEIHSASELTLAYEALRAQATGALPTVTPRGLAVFLAAGFPTWIGAWTPLAPMPTRSPSGASDCHPPGDIGREVVQLLAEMALSCQKRWATG